MRPTVRVTQLEKFRRWMDAVSEFETEDGVVDAITGEFHGNAYTRIGTAFHAIVETGRPTCSVLPDGREFSIDGCLVRLDTAQCRTALAYRDEHPHALHEVRAYGDYGDAIVTGCADMVDGLDIRDIKTKFSGYFSDADYTGSCQWRFYLDLFRLDRFFFDLFIFDGYKIDKHGYDARGLTLYRHTPAIECLRYDRMHADNVELLGEFIDWAKQKDDVWNALVRQSV
ncbi:hypothetical protein [Prevotella sp. KH2C16]|uniref:hypothetical protein n=1 Tax=Prevotella sp. KH2C16 TaxID=1855325 RepID=UPI0008EFDB5C|nr:hypothetical protein [Prevotella sp. KH2C16]SFG12936.1 hypothetical protein SAMN05216383_105179 [Prevotella sp. KH2C16]